MPGGSDGKESACIVRDLGSIPGLGRAWQPTPVLAWRTPWTEEPGGLPLMGLQRVNMTEAT